MAEIHWIKLRIDMFDDEKIKIIQSMPEGDAILVIWIRIIALAGKCNAGGLVLVEDEFPYTDEMLSVIFNKPLATVRLALKTFEKFRMIESTEKGFYITNFDKHQNVEGMDKIREQNRIRKQRERAKKKALGLEVSDPKAPALPDAQAAENGNVTNEVTGMSRDKSCEVTQQREEEEKEKEYKDISSDEDILSGPADETPDPVPDSFGIRLDYRHIMADFHDTCIDLPTIRAISETRKKKIRTLLNEFKKLKIWPGITDYDRLHRLFQMAQDSDFLSGRNGRWNGCSFDWLINKTNALKVLEGTYANKGGVNNARSNTGTGNNGESGNADARPLEGTTLNALERFRRNAGAAEDL